MNNNVNFTDVVIDKRYGPSISYRTGMYVFEEGMRDGALVALSHNAAGYMMANNNRPAPSFMDTNLFARPQSFWLEIDGQSICSHLEYIGCDVEQTATGKRAVITLRHTVRPVMIKVHTLLDGTSVMQRYIEVINGGDKPMAISAVSPLSGGLQVANTAMFSADCSRGAYRVGSMVSSRWGEEGNFGWQDVPAEILTLCGRYRRDRHRHPFAVLENKLSGESFVMQLAWSAGYAFEFDYRCEEYEVPRISIDARIDGPAPLRMLDPGESWVSPAVHIGAVFGGLDNAVNAMHAHLRKSVLRAGSRTLIEAGIGPEFDMDRETTFRAMEHAASVGVELFFIDAGWYLPLNCEEQWWSKAGNWRVDRERYPDGIAEMRERAHSLGMKFGMWMDAERIGKDSDIAHEHPEYITTGYDGKPREGGLLDLSKPEVVEWMEGAIARLIEENKLDMFRLDWNIGAMQALGCTVRDGYVENSYVRHCDAVYGVYSRLKERFPDVVFENCAGGGGRTDIGMVANFTHTWVTDWQLNPKAARITNGMTMCLPPEYLDRLMGGQQAYMTADLAFQIRVLMFGHMTIGSLKPSIAESNPLVLDTMREHVKVYKEFIRPMMPTALVFHHTPELTGPLTSGKCILELAAPDGSKGVIGAFRLAEPCERDVTVIPHGVNPAVTYEVTFMNAGDTPVRMSGVELRRGLNVQLGGALTSEMILYRAV